jgi:uncharacterized protein YdcH (DUF465 family)
MEKELQKKLEWLEQRFEEQVKIVESIESNRQFNRSSSSKTELTAAKKEKLRLKDHIHLLRKLDEDRTTK